MDVQTLIKFWRRSLLGGVVWFSILYGIDVIASYYLISHTTKRVRHDDQTSQILIEEVASFLGQVFMGYLFLGLLAGIVVHFFILCWFPKEPTQKQWIKAWLGFGVTTSLWLNFYQFARYPTLHDWMPNKWRFNIHDFFSPAEVLQLSTVWVIGGVLWAFWRWKEEDKKNYLIRLGFLGLVVFGITKLLTYPKAPTPLKNEGMNVVIIGVDGLRPDHLKREGYFRDTAPNIEAFMDEAVVFSDAYAVLARTYPSWTSIMTGMLPINNGIRNNIISDLIPKAETIAQSFQDAGWYTSFATDDSRFSYMQHELGWTRLLQPKVGAQNFALSATEPRFRMFHLLMHNPIGYWIAPVIRHNQALGKSYRPELFNEANIEEIHHASQQERFFYATHACFLHAPGDRNYPWSQMYDQKGYTRYNRLRYSRSGTKLVFSEETDDDPVNIIAEQDARIYDSGIDMADQMVKRIIDELKASGLWENTVVVLLSDHGENHWAPDLPYKWHGPNHGFHPYGDGQHEVVLAIRFPDGQFAGKEVKDTVRLIDLAPTLIEYFQLKSKNQFDGKSLFPLMRGEEEEEVREVYIETGMTEPNYWPEGHREYSYKKVAERYWIRPDNHWVMVRDEFWPELLAGKDRVLQMGKWKLVWRPMTEEEPLIQLFDREDDVENRLDVSSVYPVHTAYLGMRLLKYLERDGEKFEAIQQWEEIVRDNEEPDWRK